MEVKFNITRTFEKKKNECEPVDINRRSKSSCREAHLQSSSLDRCVVKAVVIEAQLKSPDSADVEGVPGARRPVGRPS